ncbi:MAG: YggS family pyridoxal phosphate-dependent enzyme [Caldilineaceae bacterium]|nr:YggS family pyridoxal phosphate-dependent enzyme [Caldilineaceae bacterium]
MHQPTDPNTNTETLSDALQSVRARIDAAATRAGRDPAEITLVAVSKTKSIDLIAEAATAGQVDFGENRLEELWEKVELARQRGLDGIRWHMIGTIQSRKTADCIGPFTLIHSVDRLKIAQRLNREANAAAQILPILLEINVSGEESKHGFTPVQLLAAMPQLLTFTSLRYEGLMTMAPLVDDPETVRPVFRNLRQLLEQLRSDYPPAQYEQVRWRHLSMGMTSDFEVAIEEGATLVRIGTAIFGKRE